MHKAASTHASCSLVYETYCKSGKFFRIARHNDLSTASRVSIGVHCTAIIIVRLASMHPKKDCHSGLSGGQNTFYEAIYSENANINVNISSMLCTIYTSPSLRLQDRKEKYISRMR